MPAKGLLVVVKQAAEQYGMPDLMRALLMHLDWKAQGVSGELKEQVESAAATLRPAVEKAWADWVAWLEAQQ
jgi:hypothetical protein